MWERLIGVVRRILDAIILETSHKQMTHEVLVTFMAEISAIVNARPIAPVSSDPENPMILSPSTLLTQKQFTDVAPFENLDVKQMYKSQWKHVQVLADRFWKRWRFEYLQLLQSRHKWKADNPNIKEGDVILMKDKEAHRNNWPIGIVQNAIHSEDGKVRKVELKVIINGQPTTYIRPIAEIVYLFSLPENNEDK